MKMRTLKFKTKSSSSDSPNYALSFRAKPWKIKSKSWSGATKNCKTIPSKKPDESKTWYEKWTQKTGKLKS